MELLCGLTQSENPALRVNGIWALMVCSTLLHMSSFTKRTELFSKLKLKDMLFEMSGIFFLKNTAILAQYSNDLGSKKTPYSASRFKYKQVAWPLCASVLLLRKADRY